jgi:hypothetical protein
MGEKKITSLILDWWKSQTKNATLLQNN